MENARLAGSLGNRHVSLLTTSELTRYPMSTPEVYESPSPARRSVGLEALTEGDSLALRLTDVDLGRIYSAELCAADARASGLDEETLHEQVSSHLRVLWRKHYHDE